MDITELEDTVKELLKKEIDATWQRILDDLERRVIEAGGLPWVKVIYPDGS